MTLLDLTPLKDYAGKMPGGVLAELLNTQHTQEIFVAKHHELKTNSNDFCNEYDLPSNQVGNTVVMEAKRNDQVWYCAALIPHGTRMDMGGEVRRHLNARKVSLAPLKMIEETTDMQFGSITAVGLPEKWRVLVDSVFVQQPYVYIGSGKIDSKLKLPGAYFLNNSRYEIIQGLGKSA